jgi:hypothetical protein
MTEALDNLGRKINSTNMSIGELKGLIGTLMKSKVGPAKPLNAFAEKDDAPQAQEFNYKPLVEAFEKYVQGHTEDSKEQYDLVEEVKSLLSNLGSSKKEKKEVPDEQEQQEEESFSEKLINSLKKFFKRESKQGEIVSDSTEGLYKVFSKRGSGYTHDIYCERWLQQIYDVLSKMAEKMQVPDIIKPSEILNEIKGESFFENSRKASTEAFTPDRTVEADSTFVPKRGPTVGGIDESQYQQYMEALEQSEPFQIRIESIEDAKDFFLSLRSGAAFEGVLSEKQIRSWAGTYSTSVDDIVKYFNKEIGNLSFEEAYKNNSKFREAYERTGRKYNKDLAEGPQNQKAIMQEVIGLEARRLKAAGRVDRSRDAIEKSNRATQLKVISSLEKLILGYEVLDTVVDGLIDKERKFVQDIRLAAYQTAGVTGETRSLQKTYEDIGKNTSRTGVSRDKFQESFLRGIKSGVKDQKKLNSLVTAQLNTEKQIGVEAGSLGEQFIEYGNSFKFNEDQISAVGRGIREVGRNSGIVGEKLKQAVDSSKQFADQMRKAGTATASNISNVIGLQAEFQKVGVEGGKLLGALSSTTGFLEADAQTLALVANAAARAGLTQEMWNGEILKSNKNIKQFNSGLMQQARTLGLAGSNAEEMRASLENMSALDKRLLNLRFNAAFGMESGEVVGAIEALENKSKTLAERLVALNKEKARNLTLEEKAKIAEDERRLKLTAALAPLTAISEAAKGTKNMDEALAKFGKRRGEFEEDISALGQAWTSERDVAKSSLKTAVSTLNEGLKKAGKKQLSIDSTKIENALKDETKFRELTSELTKAEQEMSTAQQAQLDPLTSMNQQLMEANDTLRNISKYLMSGVFSSFLGGPLTTIVGAASGIASGFAKSQSLFQETADFISTFFTFKDPSGQDVTQDKRGFLKKFVMDLKEFFIDGMIFNRKPMREKGAVIEVSTRSASLSEAAEGSTSLTEAAKEAAKVVETKGVAKDASKACCDQLLDVNKSMLEVLTRIADCICSGAKNITEVKPGERQDFTPSSVGAPDKTTQAEKAAGKAVRKVERTPEEIATRKATATRLRNLRNERLNLKQQNVNLKKQKTNERIRELEIKQASAPKIAGIDLKELMSNGSQMIKTAAGIMVLAAGAVALASAIVFLSGKIMGAFDLDATKIITIAGTVGALAAAGAAIAAAGYGAYQLLKSDQEIVKFPKISELFSEDILSMVGALLILGPALVLLGATIVKMAQMIVGAFGLDITTVAETAGTVAAIVAAAGALTVAASEALEAFQDLSDSNLLKNPGKMKDLMLQGATALLIIGPGLVLLGAAIVKMSQFILGIMGLDAATIGVVTARVAALIAGTAAIAGAMIGAVAGLAGLGKLMDYAGKFEKEIFLGAAALLILAPPIVFLAAALNRIIGGILGVMGVDAGKAAKVAYDVAALIGSTALIAGAVIGALAGLWGLGALAAAVSGPQALAIFGGAAALMLLTPPVIMLASALVNMIKGVLATRDMDASTAAKTAYQVAGIIAAAGAIAVSVMAAMAGLAGLGYLSVAIGSGAWLAMVGGAAALYALTPVVLSLASSIINMAGSIAGTLISPDEINKVIEGVSSILGGAAKIAISVLASVAGLSVLGLFFASAMLAIPLMWLGTRAFNALINPIVSFIGAVREASSRIGSVVNPSEAESMSKGIATILQSVGDITKNIASTATSMASFPKYASFWDWFRGNTIANAMSSGVAALGSLKQPIANYVESIKDFSRGIGSGEARQAQVAADGIGKVLQSCSSITESIFKAAQPLKSMKKYQGVFDWLRGGISGMVYKGVDALDALSAPIKKYVGAIKAFSSEVGTTLSPRMAAEMAVGVEDILCAVGGVSKIILKNKEELSGIKYKEWGWFGTNYVSQMNSGAVALEKMSDPVLSYVTVIKRFSKKLGRRLNPRLAASMARGVAEIISGTGEVTKKVLETKEELSKIKTSTGWGWFRKDYVKKSREGVKALKELSGPIIEYVDTIKSFSSQVGAKLDVRQAASMARGVAEILGASGDVTDKIVATKDKLVRIKASEGFWLWATNIPEAMNKGIVALGALKQPIINYVSSITDFSKEIGSKVKPQEAKSSVKGLQQVASVVEVFSCVLDYLKDKINPLTKSGWFVDSPIGQMVKAKAEMDKFFPILAQFINSMIQNVSKSFTNVGELKSTVKNLTSISEIFQKVGETVGTVREKIVPITKSGWFSGSDVEAVKGAIPKFNGFFESIATFITQGLVGPISKIDDGSKLRESAKKIVGVAQLLKDTSASMESLQSMINLTTDGFFSSSPMKNINSNKDKFTQYFSGISSFINSGILEPIKKITNAEGLVEAGAKLKDIGCFIYGIRLVLDNLSGVFSLMESKSIFEKAPLEKISINKDQFSKYLETAKDFIISGLLRPSLALPSAEITIGAENLRQTASMLTSIPVVIKGLAGAVSLATDKDDFFGDTPMEKIVKSKDAFADYFKKIASFVRDGIALPVKKEFENVDLGGSSKAMSAMANIVNSVVPIIKNLSGVMGMMSGETADKLDSDFAIDKIILYKDLFADYFKKIAIFLRDGIVVPVKEVFPEMKGIREASSTLSAMSNIVSLVPRVILGMSKGFVPLVESGESAVKDTPMEAIMNNMKNFKEWFSAIAVFLKEGIVDPINGKIGDSKEIRKAGSTLSAISNVVGSLSGIIKNLSQMFGGLNERKCLQEAPVALIASQSEKFKEWFYGVISFLKLGIIDPVNLLVPDAKEMDGVRGKLRILSASMSSIPEMFDELGGSISMFSKGFIWRIINGFKISKLSKNFISMANIINEGIVKPIQKFLPSSDELAEVNDQLTEFIMIIEKVAGTMGLAGRAFLGIKPIDLEGIVSMKEGVQKVSDPTVFEAEVQKAIRGRSEMAIDMAERQAEAAAIAALSKKTGRTSLSGVEVDTQVDMEKRVVKAVARWSKENHDAALGVKAVNDGIDAGAGGPGRSNLPVVPNPVSQKEPAQAATVATKNSPVVQQSTKPEPAQAATKAVRMEEDERFQRDTRVLGKGRAAERYYRRKSLEETVAKNSPTVQQGTKPEPAQAAAVATKTSPIVQQSTKPEPAQKATKPKREPIVVEGIEPYYFNDPEERSDAMKAAEDNAKAKILEEVYRITGQKDVSLKSATLTGIKLRDEKWYWNEKADEGVAKIIAEYVPKFAEGGVVNKATLGVIGEAGPEAIVPLSGIEKYSSGIISGLYEVNSTLKKILGQITKSSKKAFMSSISRGEAGSFEEGDAPVMNTVLDIGKGALSVGLGVALAPAISKMLESFKKSMTDIVKVVSGSSKDKNPAKGAAASEGTGILGTLYSIGEGLFSMIPSFESNPADCCGAVTESADGLFGSLKNNLPKSIVDKSTSAFEGFKSRSGKAFSEMSSYFSSSFAPLTKGFTRSMNAGEGIFKSLSRGIQSQYMSITKGKSVSEMAQGAFEQIKSSGVKAFNYINSNIPQSWKENASKAFSTINNKIPQSVKDTSAEAFKVIKEKGSKAISSVGGYLSSSFAPLTKGFTRSMEAGEGIFKSLSRGITSQYMSITKGKPISEVISNSFSQIKDNGIKAFETIKSKIPQSWKDNASKAFSSVKDGGIKAFNYISSKLPQSVKDNAAKAFGTIKDVGGKALSNAGNYLSSSFAPLTKGFTRSMESGAGVFQSVSRGITSQYMSITKGKPISEIAKGAFNQIKDGGTKAFGAIKDVGGKALSNAGNYLSSSFAPLTKGFTRSMESGAGVFQSVSRGITSQYMSITKGKPISEIAKGAFNQIKDGGTKAFGYISSKLPQSVKDNAAKAFGAIKDVGGKALSNAGNYLSSSFAPLTKGFTRSMEAGEGVFKSLSRGVTSQFMSITKGKPISEIAGNAFNSIKEYGKKGMSLAGGALKGLGEKAKGGIKSAGSALGSLLPKKTEGAAGAAIGTPTAMSPVENVKKVGEAGDSVKGNFEGVKEALKNLAEGLKSFANKESFLGALNLIPTAIGLTAMIPGFLGAKLVEKMDGKKVAESLGGLAEGLKSMASGKVLLGAGAILLSSIGLLGLLPALPGLAILGAISGLVTSGLTALSSGLTAFGNAAANPMMWLGILAIAGLGAALIPLGYALSTLSPLVTAFGNAVGTVLGGIGGIITSVAVGMTSFLGAVSLEKAVGLVGIAGGLMALSGAVIAFSVATAAAGWINFFGGNSKTLDNITRLADAGPNLNLFAEALKVITNSLSDFEASLSNIDDIEQKVARLTAVAASLTTIVPLLKSVNSITTPEAPTKIVEASAVEQVTKEVPTKSVETAIVEEAQTRKMAPTSFKSQFTDDWSEKYHPAPTTAKKSQFSNEWSEAYHSPTKAVESSLVSTMPVSTIEPVKSVESSLASAVQNKSTEGTISSGLSMSDPMFSEFLNMATKGKGILTRMALPSIDVFESAGNYVSGTIESIKEKASSIFSSVYSAFASVGSVIMSGLTAVFVDLPSMILGGLSSLGSIVLSGLKSVFIDLPSMLGGLLLTGLKAVFVDLPLMILKGLGSLVSIIVSGLKAVFIKLPVMIGKLLLSGLKSILIDLPIMIGQLLLSGLKAVFVDVPVMIGGLLISGLKAVFITLPSMIIRGLGSLASIVLSGLKSVFIDLPIMLGSLLMSGFKAVFMDLPLMIGGMIISGLQSVFIDLPVWLGSTILGGITSLMGAIPGAIYNALYTAASAVGGGWIVDGLFGGGATKAISSGYEGAKSVVSGTASNVYEGAKSVVSGTVDKVKSTASAVSSGITSVGSGLWSGVGSLFGMGESPIDAIVPLISEFLNAGLSGNGILIRMNLEPVAESTKSLSSVQNLESAVSKDVVIRSREMAPTNFKSQFTDEWSEKYHPAPEATGTSLASPTATAESSLANIPFKETSLASPTATVESSLASVPVKDVAVASPTAAAESSLANVQGKTATTSMAAQSNKPANSSLIPSMDSIGTTILSGLKAVFVDIPVMIGGLLLAGLKAVFVDIPKLILSGLGSLGSIILSGLKLVFIGIPKMIGKFILGGLKSVLIDLPKMILSGLASLGSLAIAGLQAVFVTLPMMLLSALGSLGSIISSGLKAVFVDIPSLLGGLIISGMKTIFIDLPIWLGKTIFGGLTSILTGLPGAIYNTLYSAASAVGGGWIVEGLFGGGGSSKPAGGEAASPAVKEGPKVAEAPISKVESALSKESVAESRTMTPTNFKSQFTDEWSEKYHPAPTERLSEKLASPDMIRHVDEVVGGKRLDGAVPGQVESIGGAPSTSVPVAVSTASPTAANKANIEQKLMKDKASLAPAKSEVVSPELGALTTETEEQTVVLNQMKELFEQFLELLKPKSQASTAEGGDPGSTLPKNVVGKPTNYYRRVAGNVGQGPGKATLNLGAKAVS